MSVWPEATKLNAELRRKIAEQQARQYAEGGRENSQNAVEWAERAKREATLKLPSKKD